MDLESKLMAKSRRIVVSKKASNWLGSGSTLLNLACSGRYSGCFQKGGYYFVVGDSASGKTFLTLTCLAEAAISKHFDEYRFIHDDVEGGAQMDVSRFFGQAVEDRLEPPNWTEDELPLCSYNIDDFYDNLDAALEEGTPFIYILDSMDSLDGSAVERDKREAQMKKRRDSRKSGKKLAKEAGSYGDGKAKVNSARLREALPRIKETGSILIIVNQTRDNIGFGAQFEKKTRSGGKALRFYANLEMWSSRGKKIKKATKGKNGKDKNKTVGHQCIVQIKKNRFTGGEHVVQIPIYRSYGFDDIRSQIEWLEDDGQMTLAQIGKALGCQYKSAERIVKWVEENDAEKMLQKLTKKQWVAAENAIASDRKKRYA